MTDEHSGCARVCPCCERFQEDFAACRRASDALREELARERAEVKRLQEIIDRDRERRREGLHRLRPRAYIEEDAAVPEAARDAGEG